MIFEELNPELQDKVKACNNAEELIALAEQEGYELTNEQLESVSGGSWNSCDEYENTCGVPYWR